MITNIEIGWLAGLLEGEGYFGFNGRSKVCITFSVSMTDEDVIHKLASICEKITGRLPNVYTLDRFPKMNDKWQTQYKVQVNGDSAREIMLLVVSQMGYRRRQRIWQILNGYKEPIKSDMKAADLLKLVVNK